MVAEIVACLPRCPVCADKSIFAAHFPIIIRGIVMVIDAGEESFGTGTVSCDVQGGGSDRYNILSPREDERVVGIVVAGNAVGRFAGYTGDAQAPAKTKWSVSIAGAVHEVQRAEIRFGQEVKRWGR